MDLGSETQWLKFTARHENRSKGSRRGGKCLLTSLLDSLVRPERAAAGEKNNTPGVINVIIL